MQLERSHDGWQNASECHKYVKAKGSEHRAALGLFSSS